MMPVHLLLGDFLLECSSFPPPFFIPAALSPPQPPPPPPSSFPSASSSAPTQGRRRRRRRGPGEGAPPTNAAFCRRSRKGLSSPFVICRFHFLFLSTRKRRSCTPFSIFSAPPVKRPLLWWSFGGSAKTREEHSTKLVGQKINIMIGTLSCLDFDEFLLLYSTYLAEASSSDLYVGSSYSSHLAACGKGGREREDDEKDPVVTTQRKEESIIKFPPSVPASSCHECWLGGFSPFCRLLCTQRKRPAFIMRLSCLGN